MNSAKRSNLCFGQILYNYTKSKEFQAKLQNVHSLIFINGLPILRRFCGIQNQIAFVCFAQFALFPITEFQRNSNHWEWVEATITLPHLTNNNNNQHSILNKMSQTECIYRVTNSFILKLIF